MSGVNKAIIIGNLGSDPDVRYTAAGVCITNVSVATSEQWKDKTTGEKKEQTEWHKVVFFGRLGEVARDYLVKGSKVYVEGKITNRKWQDKEGQDRYTTEIVGRELQMLGEKINTGADKPQASKPKEDPVPEPVQDNAFDDDIPF